MKKKPDYDNILYALIIVSCLIVTWLFLSVNFNPDRATFELYFKNYPSQISEGQNLSFSVMLSVNNSNNPLTVIVSFDSEVQREMKIVNPCCSAVEADFNLENSFRSGEEHTIAVNVFDKGKVYTQLGSASKPYYISFRVKIV